jgi:hypothetical protein
MQNKNGVTITVKGFIYPEELAQEMQNAGCFIPPLVKELSL